jgi:predicted  nucleic acid-binding Zn-ribbon protein
MSASLGLFRLQQVDTKIDRTRSQLDTIRKTLENNTELNTTLAQVEEAKAEFLRAKQELKNIEAEAESQKIKVEQNESSLYGGKVQNPKELQDLQKDVASLKKHLGVLEDRELASMLSAENKETLLNAAQSQLNLVQSRLGSEHKQLLEEQSKLMKDLDRLSQEREASVSPIETELLTIYDDLRKQKRGVAVSDFSDNACSSCGSSLNASLQQNAKSSKQLAYCPTCGRILYAS